ncbi:unnamed protein product, partial [Prunus brigantina]
MVFQTHCRSTPPVALKQLSFINNAPRVRGRLNHVVRGMRLRLTNNLQRPMRNVARVDLVSPRSARNAARLTLNRCSKTKTQSSFLSLVIGLSCASSIPLIFFFLNPTQ